MLESNAETYRVERYNEPYLADLLTSKRTEALSIATGLVATLDDPSIDDAYYEC